MTHVENSRWLDSLGTWGTHSLTEKYH
eukprot:COSAG02_NODE_11685_length_1673_cov_10.128104_2_plen_26_part_01